MDERTFIDEFCEKLKTHAHRKADLYDGVRSAGRSSDGVAPTSFWMSCAIEEIGEVASALNRGRFALAYEECVDLAHTAMLVALATRTNHLQGE